MLEAVGSSKHAKEQFNRDGKDAFELLFEIFRDSVATCHMGHTERRVAGECVSGQYLINQQVCVIPDIRHPGQ